MRSGLLLYDVGFGGKKKISEIWQRGADEIGSRRALAVVAKAMALGTKQEGEEEGCMQRQQSSVRS
jgi:hypothetical protein